MKRVKRKTVVRGAKAAPFKEFVVVVRFPSSMKEYSYKCNIPGVRQGSRVVANGTVVEVIRTAACDERAVRYVQDASVIERQQRRQSIMKELSSIAAFEDAITRYAKLKNPRAKALLRELKGLA